MNRGIFILILGLAIGYLLGLFLPIHSYEPRNIAALATLFAACVALFKEDIINVIKNPQLILTFKNERAIEGKESANTQGIANDTKMISAFVTNLEITNNGRGIAKNVEIVIDKIYNMPANHIRHTYYDIEPLVLKPIGKESAAFNIQKIRGKVCFTLIEISKQQTTNEENSQIRPMMKIGDFTVPPSDMNTKEIKIDIIIYAENCDHITKTVKVTWNGEWANSLETMNNKCQIEFCKK